ncbi:uncharacterized protein LOC110933567 [Helianthus annuus]|uniref:uncharacterized protein LOC110933567 n=1 Tax=Helianthus annuus TaxID=4232 RepID=UPI000B8F61EE|nr:uncharacterized protein LOC110933567 [Helianthus annuus]
MNANGFFFFKFSNEAGMLDALKEGPWIIRPQPLFLSVWNPTVKLEKKEVKKVQVWVKIHDIPLAAYTEDGLSMIATTIGEPILLDSYTTSMCMDMWGRSSYARSLIEVSAEKDLCEEITLAIPEPEGEGAPNAAFGHSVDSCPKLPKNSSTVKSVEQKDKHPVQDNRYAKKYPVIDEDGYQGVQSKKVARKQGFQVNKQKPKFEYRSVTSKLKGEMNKASSSNGIVSRNPFDVLNDAEVYAPEDKKQSEDGQDDLDSEEVVEVYNEMDEFILKDSMKPNDKQGASTPSTVGSNG